MTTPIFGHYDGHGLPVSCADAEKAIATMRDVLAQIEIDLGNARQNLEYLGDERDAYKRERDEALVKLERFRFNAEILSASTIGEAFDRIEETIAERDQARAEVERLQGSVEHLNRVAEKRQLKLEDAWVENEKLREALADCADREDPETGAPLPAGVEGVSLGRRGELPEWEREFLEREAAKLSAEEPWRDPNYEVTDAEWQVQIEREAEQSEDGAR